VAPVRKRTGPARSRLRSVVAAAVAMALLSAVGAAADGTAPTAAPSDPAGVLAGTPVRGMILAGFGDNPRSVLGDLPRLKSIGVNTVSMYVSAGMATVSSNSIDYTTASPSDDVISLMSRAAHQLGMAVQLLPIPEVRDQFVWRGRIRPSNVQSWFASYALMLKHYVTLANKLQIEIFAIGSELTSMQGYTANWRALAAWTNAHYGGMTTYMATAPTTTSIPWWDSLDVISISPYFSLSKARVPSVSEMVTAWRRSYLPDLARLSAKFHRSMLFDEIGYASVEYTAYKPAVPFAGHPAESAQAQANAYQALLVATSGQTWLRGVVWWFWGLPFHSPRKGYIIRDKKAECVLASYWSTNNVCLALRR
jgi:hypothetical protein